MKFVRQTETSPVRKSRLAAEKDRIHQRRLAETAEERQIRLKAFAKKMENEEEEETQEAYEERLKKQLLRQRKLRQAETHEQHQLRVKKQNDWQKLVRSFETVEEQNERKNKLAEAKASNRKDETDEQRKTRLDVQRVRQQKLRESLSEQQQQATKKKETALRKQRRDADKPSEKPYTQREKEYVDAKCPTGYWRTTHANRLRPVVFAGSFIQYLLDILKENLEESGDWKWLYNSITKETIMASEFETLSKKYAVVFQQLGIARGDVVYFFVDIHKHAHIYPALAGLWILGAIGSLGNCHKWTKTSEKYQSEWAKGQDKYKSDLELEYKNVRFLKIQYFRFDPFLMIIFS